VKAVQAPDLIISRLSGGLGNQLFQYAAACALAQVAGARVGLDVSSFSEIDDGRKCLVDRYAAGIPIVAGTVIDPQFLTAAIRTVDSPAGMRLPVVRENDYDFDPAVLSRRGGAYLYGFWQSWKYFNDISGVVRNSSQNYGVQFGRRSRAPRGLPGSGHL
jgi:hypothetical protein